MARRRRHRRLSPAEHRQRIEAARKKRRINADARADWRVKRRRRRRYPELIVSPHRRGKRIY